MEKERIHRSISPDGIEIAGRVHGHGPPLVLVHGAFEDGDTCWVSLLPYLSDRFTCYAMSLRGRGLSGRSHDVSPERLVQDVTAFVDSIGDPVFLMGESGGGFLALGAAARSDAVSAVAVYEPVVFEVQSKEHEADFQDTVERANQAAEQGRLAEAIGTFASWLANDDEMEVLSASDDAIEALVPNVTVQLQEFRQGAQFEGVSATDPSELAEIKVPVLLLHGSRTALRSWFTAGVRHVAENVAEAHVREVEGAGHFGVALAPEPIAAELDSFLPKAA